MANSGIPKTFDPKLVIFTFGGVPALDFMDGTVIETTAEDNFEAVEGADGSEDRVNKNKLGCDITLTLKQTSITNDVYSAFFLVDQATNAGKLPLLIKDLNGTTLLSSNFAYIKKLPDESQGDTLSSRAWVFRAPQAIRFVGGNIL